MHGNEAISGTRVGAHKALIPERRRPLRERIFGETPTAWFFILPALLLLVAIYGLPFIWALLLSFERNDLLTPGEWIGLANYEKLAEDPKFSSAVGHTLTLAAIVVPCTLGLGLSLALSLNRRIRFIGIYRTLIIVPFVLAYAVQAVLFSFIFDSQYGVANALLDLVGIAPQGFFSDPSQALYAIAVVAVWSGTGFCLIVFLAALQDVPQELVEAAAIDGAGRWGTFWHVIVPALRPIILFLFIWQTLIVLQTFDLVFVSTGGGPLDSTTTIVFFVYQQAFRMFNAGFGAAAAVFLGFALIALAGISALIRRRAARFG